VGGIVLVLTLFFAPAKTSIEADSNVSSALNSIWAAVILNILGLFVSWAGPFDIPIVLLQIQIPFQMLVNAIFVIRSIVFARRIPRPERGIVLAGSIALCAIAAFGLFALLL
jgi:hypothetical protein